MKNLVKNFKGGKCKRSKGRDKNSVSSLELDRESFS